jgi:hypothetical protein
MNFKPFGIACLVVILTACSSQPTQPTAKAVAPAATRVATAPAAAAAAAPPAAPAASASGNGPPVNRTLISAGYKPVTIKGEVYYCRTVDVTNTAFKKKVCLNESQIADEEKKIKQMQEEMLRQRANPGCNGPGCGG